MHNNFYFLTPLSASLNKKIIGFTVVSCFSQSKDELIIELNNSIESFFIKANLGSDFSGLSFPEKFYRAKKNSVDLFEEIILKKILSVRQFQNERSFAVDVEGSFSLVFKMHGNFSNILLAKENKVIEIFRNHLLTDFDLELDKLNRVIDFSKENFLKNINQLEPLYFTFGKVVWNYLNSQKFESIDAESKWKLFEQTLSLLKNPNYYLIKNNKDQLSFSLLPLGGAIPLSDDPISAANEFTQKSIYHLQFHAEKNEVLQRLATKRKSTETYLNKSQIKLNELLQDNRYRLWADLIMANLHTIKMGTEKIELLNFYDDSTIEIKLKRTLNAQQNAEVFYRKTKNQQIENDKLDVAIRAKEKELNELKWMEAEIHQCADIKMLREKILAYRLEKNLKEKVQALPYREHEFKGFKIWVGKNAKTNDELTLKYSYKEDLWLHAKDVAGSHVLIKYQAGKKIPTDVIEHAASLAAFYSKRKNESLCPVTVTPKKFVRKRKGDPLGMVVVEKEEVILANRMI